MASSVVRSVLKIYRPSPHKSGFQCRQCGAKEPPTALFLKDATANQLGEPVDLYEYM